MNNVLFSSNRDDWCTPKDLFNELDNHFHFTLDACASDDNHLCNQYFTKDNSCLDKDWSNEVVFMNPPFGRDIYDFVRKAYLEGFSKRNETTVVCLLPARTDTLWFHDFCAFGQVFFIRGRLRFQGAKHNAPFPCMIVIFDIYEVHDFAYLRIPGYSFLMV